MSTQNNMKYVRFGNTGLKVSKFALGCMSYGSSKWQEWVKDEEESLEMIGKAYRAGINFFDTADAYSNGESERILGKAIKKFNMDRRCIVVATKVFNPVSDDISQNMLGVRPQDGPMMNRYGLSRKHIFESVDRSLARLGLDYIDLYQIHRWDPNTPIEETMEALNDLVRMGKVRYIGASSMLTWQFQKANHIAEMRGWTKFVSMQNLYNLAYREEEREMIPYCIDQGIAMIPWSPLAHGLLAGKNRKSVREETDKGVAWFFKNKAEENTAAVVDRVVEVAAKKGLTPARVALAWILSKPFVTAPILGITKDGHLEDGLAALDIQLSEEEIAYLEEVYMPRPLIPM